eukprot:2065453-Amphidinium_carterae.1
MPASNNVSCAVKGKTYSRMHTQATPGPEFVKVPASMILFFSPYTQIIRVGRARRAADALSLVARLSCCCSVQNLLPDWWPTCKALQDLDLVTSSEFVWMHADASIPLSLDPPWNMADSRTRPNVKSTSVCHTNFATDLNISHVFNVRCQQVRSCSTRVTQLYEGLAAAWFRKYTASIGRKRSHTTQRPLEYSNKSRERTSSKSTTLTKYLDISCYFVLQQMVF